MSRNLKQLYRSTIEEPVPQHFIDLISKLDDEPVDVLKNGKKPGKARKR